jgi:uncharacterized protein
MKLNGTHKFKVSSDKVYNAILDPAVLKASIPGSSEVVYASSDTLQVRITTSIPGLSGPYTIAVGIADRQPPAHLALQVKRSGRGGNVDAVANIDLADAPDGAQLSYHANAELSGPVAIVNNPLGQGIVKKSLDSFFNNLDQALS